jgi:hypothetical protein
MTKPTMKPSCFQALAVRALGRLHQWCERRYRQKLLRAELQRIGKVICAARQQGRGRGE